MNHNSPHTATDSDRKGDATRPCTRSARPGQAPSGSSKETSKDASTTHLNTPVNNPPVDDPPEVAVTDPTHPLFGRRFALLSTRPRPHSVGYIFVVYRNTMVLRLPHAATSLVAAPPESESRTKLTSHAITELISFAEQCEVLCPATKHNSGPDSPPRGKRVSAPTSRHSSRR